MPPRQTRKPKVPNPEAEQALAGQVLTTPETGLDATDSVAADNFIPFIDESPNRAADGTNTDFLFDAGIVNEPIRIDEPVGETLDAAVNTETPEGKPDPDKQSVTKGFGRRRRKNPDEPKATPPNLDEWMDFFSRIVIRFMTEWYVDMLFRDIEDQVTDDDALKLLLTEEERDTIARPFAEYANKNPWMRKHGRQIVAVSDSFESVVMLARWFGRVNRVRRKYQPKPKKPVQSRVERVGPDGNFGQSQAGAESANGSGGFAVFNPGSG